MPKYVYGSLKYACVCQTMLNYACESLKYTYGLKSMLIYSCICKNMLVEVLLLFPAFSLLWSRRGRGLLASSNPRLDGHPTQAKR